MLSWARCLLEPQSGTEGDRRKFWREQRVCRRKTQILFQLWRLLAGCPGPRSYLDASTCKGPALK